MEKKTRKFDEILIFFVGTFNRWLNRRRKAGFK